MAVDRLHGTRQRRWTGPSPEGTEERNGMHGAQGPVHESGKGLGVWAFSHQPFGAPPATPRPNRPRPYFFTPFALVATSRMRGWMNLWNFTVFACFPELTEDQRAMTCSPLTAWPKAPRFWI